jgi:hypothetical protein
MSNLTAPTRTSNFLNNADAEVAIPQWNKEPLNITDVVIGRFGEIDALLEMRN